MCQLKCVLFAVVALMTVGSSVAIIGGQDAARGQFPYFVYIEAYKTSDLPVICKHLKKTFTKVFAYLLREILIILCHLIPSTSE